MDHLNPYSTEDPWSRLPAGPRRLLAQAAAAAFGKRGYHATTTRDIAERVGMSPAGMYVHYPSKAELLFVIARIGHESVFDAVRQAVDALTAPEDRVRAMMQTFTTWHAVHHVLARVLQYELRSLEAAHYEAIAEIRRQTENFAASELRPLVPNPEQLHMSTVAVLSLGIDTARWYNPKKSPRPVELGEAYATMVLRMLRA